MEVPKNAVPVLMEKPVEQPTTVDGLTNKDHVGLIFSNNHKAYVAKIARDLFGIISVQEGLTFCNYIYGDNPQKNISATIQEQDSSYRITQIFKFDTRRALYAWLAQED